MRNRKKLYISLSIIFTLLISGVTMGVRHYNKLKTPQDLFAQVDNGNEGDELDINGQFDRNYVNLLIVGFDRDEARSEEENIFRTDTNILASINLEEKKVDLISIPRDSYVPIAHMNGKKDKFNSSFVHGYLYGGGKDIDARTRDGYRYLLDTTKDLLGNIPLSYYVAVDMDVVQEIVDAIGGVDIYIPQDVISMIKKDVVMEKGNHHLNGKDLMYYARNRQLKGGDIDRVKKQQEIIMAIFNTLKKSNKFTALPKILNSMMDNIETNMNINQMTALALFGMDLDMANIKTHMIDGDFGDFNGLSYWIINQEARADLVKDVFGKTIVVEAQDPTVETVNSLNVNASKTRYKVGEQGKITATGSTNSSAYKTFKPSEMRFSSSDRGVAVVDGSGVIRALGAGEATITVSVGNISRTISIVVNNPSNTNDNNKPSNGNNNNNNNNNNTPNGKPGGKPSEKPKEEPPVDNGNKPGEPELPTEPSEPVLPPKPDDGEQGGGGTPEDGSGLEAGPIE